MVPNTSRQATAVPRHVAVAEALRGDLGTAVSAGRLPSVGVLAHRYSVSKATMLKALHALREQGLLSFSQGTPVPLMRRGCSDRLDIVQKSRYGAVDPVVTSLIEEFVLAQTQLGLNLLF